MIADYGPMAQKFHVTTKRRSSYLDTTSHLEHILISIQVSTSEIQNCFLIQMLIIQIDGFEMDRLRMFIHTFSLHLVTEPECVLAGDLLSRICMLFLEGLFKDFALSMELSQLMIKLKWDRFTIHSCSQIDHYE